MAAEYEDEISVNPPKIDGYADISYIKSGLYGDVFSATTTDGSKYAIKSMDLKNASLIEIDLMMRLNHVNIIRGVEVILDERKIYLVEELATPGECDQLRYFDENDKIRIIFELGSALGYIQDNCIAHCDIKPDNILFSNKRVKLSDLGLAQYIDHGLSSCGTLLYQAPEYAMTNIKLYGNPPKGYKKTKRYKNLLDMVGKKKFDKRNILQGEVWSYGIYCLDVLYGKEEILSSKEISLIDFFHAKNKKKFLREKIGLPKNVKLFDLVINNLLRVDLTKRCNKFSSFISMGYFLENGYEDAKNVDIIESRSDKNTTIYESDRKSFKIGNDWILWVCNQNEVSNLIVFVALDLYRDLWDKYAYGGENECVFSSTCVYLAHKLVRVELSEHEFDRDYGKISKSGVEIYAENVIDCAFYIVSMENGKLGRDTLYNYLSSVEILAMAILFMDTDEYYNLSTKEYADSIIRYESHNEVFNRTLKKSVTFNGIYEKLSEGRVPEYGTD
jgi:serine/threonine protein kinase